MHCDERNERCAERANSSPGPLRPPRLARLAAVAPFVGLFVAFAWQISFTIWEHVPWLPGPLLWASFLFPAGLLAVGIVAFARAQRGPGQIRFFATHNAAANLVLAIGFAFLLRVDFPAVYRARAGVVQVRCAENVRALLVAMSEFAANNGERFPDARAWCDQLLPYVPDKEVFVCPSRPQLRCGYAFNSALGGVRYDSIKDPAKVVVIFETDRGWNAAGGPELLSAHDSRFPGYNIGFADGSVRLVSPLRE